MAALKIRQLRTVSSVLAGDWNALIGGESPFLEHGFLATLEETGCVGPGTTWTPQILGAFEGDQLVGAVPFYRKTDSRGEFVFDWAWADASHRAQIPYYPKGVVAVPFTPVTGARLLVHPDRGDRREIMNLLVKEVLNQADEAKLSSVHFNFITESERTLFEKLNLPLRLGVQYHWENDGYACFDDYLARFRSKMRANIRRERRALADRGVITRVLRGSDLSPLDLQRVFHFYQDTVNKYFYGQQYLDEAFFLRLLESLGSRLHVVFIGFADEDEPFGAAFNLFKGKRLYGRYWGSSQEVPFAHFETCIYRPVQWCIENGVEHFEPGAGGEHKFDRGFLPSLTYSAHYLRHPGLRRGVEEFLKEERRLLRRHVEEMRQTSPFK